MIASGGQNNGSKKRHFKSTVNKIKIVIKVKPLIVQNNNHLKSNTQLADFVHIFMLRLLFFKGPVSQILSTFLWFKKLNTWRHQQHERQVFLPNNYFRKGETTKCCKLCAKFVSFVKELQRFFTRNSINNTENFVDCLLKH